MDILPYEGFGPLRFGMNPQEVERLLGNPVARMKNFLGELKLVYHGMNAEFGGDGLVEVTLKGSPEITFQGQVILNLDKKVFVKQSKEALQGNGSIVLLDFGIAIPDEEKAMFPLTVFARGRLDPLLTSYKRLS
jgi:hypothetical protein